MSDALFDVIDTYTAGDPMNEEVRWTHLYPKEIVESIGTVHNIKTSRPVVKKLLKEHGFRRRKAQKKVTMGCVPNRNEQFENIARLRAEYEAVGNPIMSVDTKKKEKIGTFYREGQLYTQKTIEVNDHDFRSYATGIVIPHGIYDLTHNHGYLHLGTSNDTSEFACDSILSWWEEAGKGLYPTATSILLLCDGGGSNSSHYYIFKEELQRVANTIGIEIRIAHYPPYCSKYNPIEHRLFPHVTRACQGVVFTTIDVVKTLMARTKTATGLTVTVKLFEKLYEKGRHVSKTFKENMPIIFDDYLPKWNYRAVPQTGNTSVI